MVVQITVKLFALLLRYGPEQQKIDVPPESTVEDVVKMLNIPRNMPALRIVNSVHVQWDLVLQVGDVLALFPPIAGGRTSP